MIMFPPDTTKHVTTLHQVIPDGSDPDLYHAEADPVRRAAVRVIDGHLYEPVDECGPTDIWFGCRG